MEEVRPCVECAFVRVVHVIRAAHFGGLLLGLHTACTQVQSVIFPQAGVMVPSAAGC